MRIVLDTNVLISGIFWRGVPNQILSLWRDKKLVFVVTLEILEEYSRVANELSSKHQKIDLNPLFELLTVESEFCTPVKLFKHICEDPDDEKFIECAIAGNVKYIVTGDNDLLKINGYRHIKIVRPQVFLKEFS
jgi:putative PIN family toxin of toxin-antitoxin system